MTGPHTHLTALEGSYLTGLADDRPWGILESDDGLAAAREGMDSHAGWSMKDPPVTVTPDLPLEAAWSAGRRTAT